MERYHITGDLAFLLLTRASRNTSRKLHELAAELIESAAIVGAHR